jgi:hypothetical protein
LRVNNGIFLTEYDIKSLIMHLPQSFEAIIEVRLDLHGVVDAKGAAMAG